MALWLFAQTCTVPPRAITSAFSEVVQADLDGFFLLFFPRAFVVLMSDQLPPSLSRVADALAPWCISLLVWANEAAFPAGIPAESRSLCSVFSPSVFPVTLDDLHGAADR